MIQVPDDEGACKYYDETYEKNFEGVDDDVDDDGDDDDDDNDDDDDDDYDDVADDDVNKSKYVEKIHDIDFCHLSNSNCPRLLLDCLDVIAL